MTPKPDERYLDIRKRVFAVTSVDLGLPALPANAPVWGLLMETGYEEGSMTFLGLAEGTASLYLSTGTVVIGGGEHESVRRTSQLLLETANELRRELKAVDEWPLPKPGRVVFYMLTDGKPLSRSADEEALAEGKHALSPLYQAAHDVIAEIRELTGE